MILSNRLYQTIIKNTIILCADIFLYQQNKMLLIRRTQEPLKGIYWPIGGRVQKSETAEQAAKRIIQRELGIDYKGELTSVGYFEEQFTENSFMNNTHYHTLSIVFRGQINNLSNIVLDMTSDDYQLFDKMPLTYKIKKFEI